MKVHGHSETLGCLEDDPELAVVQILAADVRVDLRAAQAELGDRAGQFLGCGIRVSIGERGKSGKSSGMRLDRLGEPVIGVSREANAVRAVKFLNSRAGQA